MIEVRQTAHFRTWFDALRDDRAKARIVARIRRFELGNLGDIKPIEGPVSEARIDYGPGYRLYFARRGNMLVILLTGGEKGTQRRDIKDALEIEKELK